MAEELEAKFKVANFRAVRKSLRAAGAVYRGTAILTDAFFDTPDRRLYRGDSGLRLRQVRITRGAPGGLISGWVLTYKGPRRSNRRAKVRTETQTILDDGEAMGEVLRSVGLQVFLEIEKCRASYKLGRCLVELDDLPKLGCFVEIEAPDERLLESARRKLNLTGDPITETYPHLLAESSGPNFSGRN